MSKVALIAASTLLCGGLLAAPTHAAPAPKAAKKATAAKKKPAGPGTLGTTQMAGGQGLFGQTYTLVGGGDYGPINFTLTSAEYSVERINMASGDSYAPKADEKLLVLHYRVKNPNKDNDFYYSSRNLFQTVDADNTTRDDAGESRRESQRQKVEYSIKPGQGIDDLITYAVIPAKSALPKLILQLGRQGTPELVTRYALGQAPNVVKPIPAPYADPADPSGATARAEIPAQTGTKYVAGYFDVSLDSVAFAPGPFGDTAADDGKRFLVATVTVTNRSWDGVYFSDTLAGTLVTADGEKTDQITLLKGARDEAWEGRKIDPNESVTVRLAFQVAKDVAAKSLTLAEKVDNSGGLSHALVYDLSGVK